MMQELTPHSILPVSLVSSLLWLSGIVVSLAYWSRRKRLSETKVVIAFGGVVGALVCAKLGYVVVEASYWWHDPVFWIRMLAGKTILGGLLGGWLGVEVAKYVLGETRIMGDEFARIIPCGMVCGRLGCLLHGCCPGLPLEDLPAPISDGLASFGLLVWPAPLAETLFQIVFFLSCLFVRRWDFLKGQQFHVYLISYGVFRFCHEPLRATVRYASLPISPYGLLALLVAILGCVGFVRRARAAGR